MNESSSQQPAVAKRGTASRRIDVRFEQVAAVYAKALLAVADRAGKVDQTLEDLDALVHEVLDPHPQLEQVLGSAIVDHDEKVGLIDRVFGKRLLPLVVDFLKVVSNHGRLSVLRTIHRELQKQVDELRGRVRVEMSTAAALPAELTSSLNAGLAKYLGAEPIVEGRIDPELIGGIVLRVGDTVYDGSVARQLVQLREQMIYRSVHEIQSRRDRFSTPS